MNNSLRRFCNSRARLVHRSKNLLMVHQPQKYPPAALFNAQGKFEPMWRVVDNRKAMGRNNGVTFAAGIQRSKRAGTFSSTEIRQGKEVAWKTYANG